MGFLLILNRGFFLIKHLLLIELIHVKIESYLLYILYQVFQVDAGHSLRSFIGHTKATRISSFSLDKIKIFSGSDDTTVKYWDLATGNCLSTYYGHTDYVSCGGTVPSSSNLWISASYDHTIKLWDVRCPNTSPSEAHHSAQMVMSLDNPVESILVSENSNLLYSAAGKHIHVWDLLSGGREIAKFCNHLKSVTCLEFFDPSHIISTSLDGRVKITDLKDYQVRHSSQLSSPVTAFAISPDKSQTVFGLSTGYVQIRSKDCKYSNSGSDYSFDLTQKSGEPQDKVMTDNPDRYINDSTKLLNTSSEISDKIFSEKLVRVKTRLKYTKYENHLRKFRYLDALQVVTRPGGNSIHHFVSLIEELIRRQVLKTTLRLSHISVINRIFRIVTKHFHSIQYGSTLCNLADLLIDIAITFSIPACCVDEQKDVLMLYKNLKILRSVIDKEANFIVQAHQILGIIDTISSFSL